MAAGLAAFLGHLFPIYLRLHGGKGVATGAGVVAVLLPIPAALILIGRAGFVEDALRPVALVLGALAAAEIGWACPDPAGPAGPGNDA